MQGVMRHIPHWYWTLTSLIPSGTLSCSNPNLPKNDGQCKPLQGLCALPKWELPNMTPPVQCRKMKKNSPSTNNVEHGFWFALAISSNVRVATKMNMLWTGL